MAENFGILQTMLHGFDYSGFLTIGHKALTGAVNHVLGAKDGKKGFADTALALSEAKAVRKEVAALAARHGCAQDLLLGRSASMACGLLCLVLLTGLGAVWNSKLFECIVWQTCAQAWHKGLLKRQRIDNFAQRPASIRLNEEFRQHLRTQQKDGWRRCVPGIADEKRPPARC